MGNKQGSHAFVETERSGDVVANPVADCTDVPLHREPNRDGVFKASDLPGHTATFVPHFCWPAESRDS